MVAITNMRGLGLPTLVTGCDALCITSGLYSMSNTVSLHKWKYFVNVYFVQNVDSLNLGVSTWEL